MNQTEPPILSVRDLRVKFSVSSGSVYAVNGVGFEINCNEVVAIVGESGSGKSAMCRALLDLLPESAHVSFDRMVLGGEDVSAKHGARASARGSVMSLVAQDPVSALDPHVPVGTQLRRVLGHRGVGSQESEAEARGLLDRVGIAPERYGAYAAELSGGMCQRVSIALALASGATLLIADEPTSNLDVTTQAKIVALLGELRQTSGLALLLVTHDLGLARRVSDRILVMYGGIIVEQGAADALVNAPVHPYTRGLLAAVPDIDRAGDDLLAIPGHPPAISEPLSGCPFVDRCERAVSVCRETIPLEESYESGTVARCHVPAVEGESTSADGTGGGPLEDPRYSDRSRPRDEARSSAGSRAADVPVVRVSGLSVRFPIRRGLFLGRIAGYVSALEEISFEVRSGETLGVIGETGAGKSTLLRSLLRLEPEATGRVEIDGIDVGSMPEPEFRPLRERLQVVFQNPTGSLDPAYTAGGAVSEPIAHHGVARGEEKWARALAMLDSCGISVESGSRGAQAFSGGQKQRIAIARSVAVPPRLLLADEPVSSLDVSVQAGVLSLLRTLVSTLGFAMLFVSHDLAVIRAVADSVLLLRAGRVVEYAPVERFFDAPESAYGRELLASARLEALGEADRE